MTLHIVEPTFNNYAGHCHSLLGALVEAAPDKKIQIWAGVNSKKFWNGRGKLNPYFYRSLRRLQAFFLYRRLLSQSGKILISTAGTSDFITLDCVAKGLIPPSKVYLYVHWVGAKATKAAKLAVIAKRQPNLEIFCTTPSCTAFFREIGFRALTVSYPRNDTPKSTYKECDFSHLVVAGAARSDKGFDRVVDLVEMLAQSKSNWPIKIQVSTPHNGKHSPEIICQINRLTHTEYNHLSLLKRTLSPTAYQALFLGGISIQPYSVSDFQDRVSGVTLDALSEGCPVVVTANTWLANIVLQYQAGVATSDLSPMGLQTAIEEILSNYDFYAQNAASAGQSLHAQNSAEVLIDAVFENLVK